jgi:hypothetical protein
MENGNRVSQLGRLGTSQSVILRFLTLLPSIPSRPSARDKIADGLFAAFVFLARTSFLVGAIVGGYFQGAGGFVLGIAAGGIIGFWIRHSLGMRGRDLTYGFFIRMGQRGVGSPPGLLESLTEKIRGHEITPYQSRLLAGAHTEFQRALHYSTSLAERDESRRTFEGKVQIALYGELEILPAARNDYAISNERIAAET